MELADRIIQYVQQHGQVTTAQLLSSMGAPSSTLFHQLNKLTTSGQLVKVGQRRNASYKLGQGQPAVTGLTPQVATPVLPLAGPAPTPEVVIIKEVKAVKAAPNQIQPLGQELLPNWCQKFGIDPAVVISRYEAVRGFIPGLSPRGRSSAKKKLLAALYSGLVLVLCFLSVWATGTRSKPMRWLKIAGLILIVGIIYMAITQNHRFTPHQNPTYGSTRYEGELIKLQEQLSDTQNQLNDAQNQLSKTKEESANNQSQLKEQLSTAQSQLSDSQSELRKTTQDLQADLRQLKEQLSNTQDELAKTKEQLTQEQEQRKNEVSTGQAPYKPPEGGSTGQVGISQIIDWTKQGVPPDVIIKSIKDSRSHYTLTPEDIYYLKKQGVSDSVIEAMSNQANSTDAQVPRQGPYNKSTGQGLVQKVKGFITNMGGL